jgi:hypothetical protein
MEVDVNHAALRSTKITPDRLLKDVDEANLDSIAGGLARRGPKRAAQARALFSVLQPH